MVAQIAPEYFTAVKDIKRQREGRMKEVVMMASQGRTRDALEVLDQNKKINFYRNCGA